LLLRSPFRRRRRQRQDQEDDLPHGAPRRRMRAGDESGPRRIFRSPTVAALEADRP
jgi:hypothetical protein